MIVVKFRSNDEHEDLLMKVKKMKKFTQELEECLEDAYEDSEPEFRGGSYRKDYEEDEWRKPESRYARMSRRMGR